MRYLILLFALYLPVQSSCQRYTLTRPQLWAGCGAAFASGAAWGLHEQTAHHWGAFQKRFPKANPQFWNPAESWRNKYVNGDPEQGRTKTPVWFTDAKHLTASTAFAGTFAAGACITIGERRPWWHYPLDALISFGFYSAGFNLFYK